MKKHLIMTVAAASLMPVILAAAPAAPSSPVTPQAAPAAAAKKPDVLPAGSILKGKLETPSGGRLFAGEPVDIGVIILDTAGQPQMNRKVEFQILTRGGKNDGKLNRQSAITDKKGTVTVTLQTDTDPRVLNVIKAAAPGIKDTKKNTVTFNIKAWPKILSRIAENYGLINDEQAVQVDRGRSGGKPLPEARFRFLAKKPDKSKVVSIEEPANFTIFNNGWIAVFKKDKAPSKINQSDTIGISFEAVNYQYSPWKFYETHTMSIDKANKPGFEEAYRIEASPAVANRAYSKLVIYADYITGLDFEVEKYGIDGKLNTVSRIKKALQWSLKDGGWTGKEFVPGKKLDADPVFKKTDFDSFADSKVDTAWVTAEMEMTSYFGDPKDEKNITVVDTTFDDIQLNKGIGDDEFAVPK